MSAEDELQPATQRHSWLNQAGRAARFDKQSNGSPKRKPELSTFFDGHTSGWANGWSRAEARPGRTDARSVNVARRLRAKVLASLAHDGTNTDASAQAEVEQ